MSVVVLLDTGVLSLVTHPKGGEDARSCQDWMQHLLASGIEFAVPEICDYELRRELLRARKARSIRRLDALAKTAKYLQLDTRTMRRAAERWSQLRRQGRTTAHDASIDGDVILGAQASVLQQSSGASPIIATTNVRHLVWLGDARDWRDIPRRRDASP